MRMIIIIMYINLMNNEFLSC